VLAVALRRLVGWTAAYNPDVTSGAVLGHSAASTMPPLAVAASGWWPLCHNRGCADVSPPWSSALLLCEHSCEFLLFPLFLCACYGGLASESSMLAYAAAAVLLELVLLLLLLS
jgi:hypothetical protein